MRNLAYLTVILVMFLCSCHQSPYAETVGFEIAAPEYIDLHRECLRVMETMDFDTWGEMLADDIIYHFPDGDEETRKVLEGRDKVVRWWSNWKAFAGIQSMTFSNANYIPVNALNEPKATDAGGVYVISYFSNKMVTKEGKEIRFRMNFNTHWNDERKIDRIYTYYDRTPIIEAMKRNVLIEEN